MPNPNIPDDSWDELARELGLERSSPPADESILDKGPEDDLPSDPDPETAPIEEERPARGHPQAASEDDEASQDYEVVGEEAELDEEAGEGETAEEGGAEEGQPGTGRKRRRRRRRRRKGGSAAPAPAAEGEAAAGEEFTVTARIEDDQLVDAEEQGDEIEEEEVLAEVGAEEEDIGGEVLRELTANWNVSSWDEIVSGLYRPER
jgi:ribonuclease E